MKKEDANLLTGLISEDLAQILYLQDDGSLPEIVAVFPNSENILRVSLILVQMVQCNNIVTVWSADGLGCFEMTLIQAVEMICLGEIESFQILLSIDEGWPYPDVGFFINPPGLVFDYRKGKEWGGGRFCDFLKFIAELGGVIRAPWWHAEIPNIDAILAEIASVKRS